MKPCFPYFQCRQKTIKGPGLLQIKGTITYILFIFFFDIMIVMTASRHFFFQQINQYTVSRICACVHNMESFNIFWHIRNALVTGLLFRQEIWTVPLKTLTLIFDLFILAQELFWWER